MKGREKLDCSAVGQSAGQHMGSAGVSVACHSTPGSGRNEWTTKPCLAQSPGGGCPGMTHPLVRQFSVAKADQEGMDDSFLSEGSVCCTHSSQLGNKTSLEGMNLGNSPPCFPEPTIYTF